MGCCSSKSDSYDTREEEEEEGGLQQVGEANCGGSKPLRKWHVTWTAEQPITRDQHKEQKEAFWDTSHVYEGRLEIWQALRLACESDDMKLAQAIIDSAQISVPTGNLSEGCYDELGNRYVIPAYCFSPPTNLIADDDAGGRGSFQAGGEEATIVCEEKWKGKNRISSGPGVSPMTLRKSDIGPHSERTITVRLSTGKDIKVVILGDERIGLLRTRVLEAISADDGREGGGGSGGGGEVWIKFFFLGKLLEDKMLVRDVNIPEPDGIVQALVSKGIREG